MKTNVAVLLSIVVLGLAVDVHAQLVRPSATPRAAATARPTATPGRIPEALDIPDSANLVVQFYAPDIPAQSDNTDLTSWTDSFADIVVSQGTQANQPNYRTAANGINGVVAVDFGTAQDKCLTNSTDTLVAAGGARTVYVVGDDPGTGEQPNTAITMKRSGLQFVVQACFNNSDIYTDAVNAGNNATSADCGDGSVTDTPFKWTWRSAGTGNDIETWRNTTSLTVSQGGSIASDTGNAGFVIGGRTAGCGQGWIGKMGEMLVYDVAHDESTRLQVWSYLDAKWNL